MPIRPTTIRLTAQEQLLAKAFLALGEAAPDPSDLWFGFVLHLRGTPPTLAELRERLAATVPALPCLTHGPALTEDGRVGREPDPSFELSQHVREMPGVEPRVLPAQSLLDDGPRSWWRLLLMPGVGDGWALTYVAHHAVQDAGAMVHTLRKLLDPDDTTELPSPDGAFRSRSPLLTLPSLLPDVLRSYLPAAATPSATVPPLRELVCRSVELARLTQAARAAGVTVNQVHLAAMAEAVGEHGSHAMVPMDTRTPEQRATETGLGNKFGLAFLPLREATATTGHRRMRRRREALRTLQNNCPETLASWYLKRVSAPERSTLTVSHVRIDRPLSVFGTPVDRMEAIPWLPPGARCFSLLVTYARRASLSVLTPGPPALSPDRLCDRWVQALE